MISPDFEVRRSVLVGDTADVYLQRTLTILRNEGINPVVVVEFAPERGGVFCGLQEVKALLSRTLPEAGAEVWALEEGDAVGAAEVALRVKAPYGSLGLYETAVSGSLASNTTWATSARECVEAAGNIPVIVLGSRYVHPSVVANMEYASVVGGCVSCSTVLGARLAGVTPAGNMPESLPLLMGDTVKAIQAFDKHMPQEVPRIALVDILRDEVEESLNVSKALREKLRGVSLNTPVERGGVTPELVTELRVRLDLAGFGHVEIMVSGGFTPDKIRKFVESGAPVSVFGVGGYIAKSVPKTYRYDIKEVEGRPTAKRGRIPGITNSPRLTRVI